MSSKSSADYYDAYSDRQVRVGINARHRAIQRWLRRFGVRRGVEVLEIGCGVGTLTELIAAKIGNQGTLLGVDLSPRSIDLARERLRRYPQVELLAADVLDLALDRTFDVIVLPDVIEHIPVEHHPRLFRNLRRWLRDTGWVLIHMPNPFFLEWCRENRPDVLQEIDQPIFADTLVAAAQPNDLYLTYLRTYSVWVPEGDYQVIVLRPRPSGEFHFPINPTRWEQLSDATLRVLELAKDRARKITAGRARRS